MAKAKAGRKANAPAPKKRADASLTPRPKAKGGAVAKKAAPPARPKAPPAAPPAGQLPADIPPGVVVRRTAEIDPADPLASGASAPLRNVWLEAAREARDGKRVVIDLVGEGRGVIAIPVAFKDEREAMAAMRPALDVLVQHVMAATEDKQQPVMVDLQELRERLAEGRDSDWVVEHRWLDTALADRELLCMYVFSPSYLLEFAVAIGKQQGFSVSPADESAGFYRLVVAENGGTHDILWNWARAIGDVIAGGHAWSYFGLLLALAPQVAKQRAEGKPPRPSEEE